VLARCVGFAYTGRDGDPQRFGRQPAATGCSGAPRTHRRHGRHHRHEPSRAVRGRCRRQCRVIKSYCCPRLLHGQEILNGAVFDRPIDKQVVIRELHAIKEALLACHKVAERVVSHVARVVDNGEKQGYRVMSVALLIHSPRCSTSTQTPQHF
jgi:hypothetical protein